MSLLTVNQVSKSYFGRIVLDQVSFRLDRGERLALVGENGAGKTTLLHLIIGIEKPDQGSVSLPAQVVPGFLSQHFDAEDNPEDHALTSPEISILEAQMHELEKRMSTGAGERLLESYGKLTARYEAIGGYDYTHRIQEILAGLGLPAEMAMRPLSTLSGGERMRVALARLLMCSPDLLLLDEPTNHLDLTAMEWLESYISCFKGAVLLVSHDRSFIDRTATSVAELHAGHLALYPGNYTHYQEIRESSQAALDQEVRQLAKELEHQQEVKQTLLSHRKMSSYHAREKVVDRLSAKLTERRDMARPRNQRLNFDFMTGHTVGDPRRILLAADNLAISFGNRLLFKEVTMSLRRGSKVCLCGPNGCGKTTLLKILMGRITGFTGQVRPIGDVVFGHMGQHVDFIDENRSLIEEVLDRSGLHEEHARTLLARYGFRNVDIHKRISVLSGGERSRLYLCCLLLEQPDLLFLDEPTNHLDIYSREVLEKSLIDFSGAILAVSHDRYFIERFADQVYGFMNGQVLPYDHFTAYRQAFLEHEAGLKTFPATRPVSDKNAGPALQTGRRQPNRADLRRETALRRERIRQIEKTIEMLEKAKQEAETSFSNRNDPEVYSQYSCILNELDQLYHEYVCLASAEPGMNDPKTR